MWCGEYLLDTIKKFLPPMAKIVVLEAPYKRPAVEMVDLDGDGVLELVGAYYWQGENYIVVLKYYYNDWYVADTIKGKGYNITYFGAAPIANGIGNNLIQILQHRTFSNQNEIDFSSIKYIYSETEKDMKLEKALVKAFELEQYEDNVRYYYNKVDLNEDGNPEIFTYLVGSPVCGTGGCSGAIFKQENGEYKLLSTFSLVNNPVIVSNIKTNGYRDIIMHVFGGGIESFFARVKYDGTTYPSNPSIQPKVEQGTKVDGIAIIADDITKNPGLEIEKINKSV